MNGEKIYEYDLDVTGMTDCGISLEEILSGQKQVPPSGVRIDIAFEGSARGRLAGPVRGTDYIRIRADGRIDMDLRAIIETEDGHRIALTADGVAVPRAAEPVADLSENVRLVTAAENYAWVNTRQVWGTGTVNLAAGKVHIDAAVKCRCACTSGFPKHAAETSKPALPALPHTASTLATAGSARFPAL